MGYFQTSHLCGSYTSEPIDEFSVTGPNPSEPAVDMRLAAAWAGLFAINKLGWAVAQEKSLKGNDLSVVYTSGTRVNFRWYVDKQIFFILRIMYLSSLLFIASDTGFPFIVVK